MRCSVVLFSTAFLLLTLAAVAQETKKAVPMTPSGRLAAAQTAYLKNAGGSAIPFKVIESAMEGWGRFKLVESPSAADLVIEVSAPEEGGGVSVSSSTNRSAEGREAQSTTTTRKLSGSSRVNLVVIDGKSKAVLWTASEQPKFAMKQKAKEDNLVEAAQRLIAKFRERVEAGTKSGND